jgi:hypothetical protein
VAASGALGAGNGVFDFAWAPDGRRLAVVGDLETDGVSELFVVSPSGGAQPVKVSGAVAVGGGVSSFTFGWTPLSN